MYCRSRFRLITLIILFALPMAPVRAQAKKVPVVVREGSWVVEWTPKSRRCVVRFYNNQQALIYEETVDRPLNIARRQTKRNLDMALEQAMYVWNATHKVPTDRQWVAIQFDKK